MPYRESVKRLVESALFQNAILGVIVFNAIILALETAPETMGEWLWILWPLDALCLTIFVIELSLKLYAQGGGFFKRGWNWFDAIIVAIALLSDGGHTSVLRAFRIFRAFRLFSAVPALRRVVTALIHAIPDVGAASGVLLTVFFICSVMATKLYGASFPDWFGTLGDSFYTLFQVMTLESWSMGIVRPVMEAHPNAWLFFVPFIAVSSFTVLNVFIGIVVSAIAEVRDDEHAAEAAGGPAQHGIDHHILRELASIESQIKALREQLPAPEKRD